MKEDSNSATAAFLKQKLVLQINAVRLLAMLNICIVMCMYILCLEVLYTLHGHGMSEY